MLILLFALFSFKKQTPEEFRMIVDDAFPLSDGKVVVTGQIKQGTLSVGDRITFSYQKNTYELPVENLEIFGVPAGTKTALAGQYTGLHVSGVPKHYFQHGAEIGKK